MTNAIVEMMTENGTRRNTLESPSARSALPSLIAWRGRFLIRFGQSGKCRRFDRGQAQIGFSTTNGSAGSQRQMFVFGFKLIQFLFREFFDVEQRVMSGLTGANQLVQFDLQRLAIAVLSVLDQEDH